MGGRSWAPYSDVSINHRCEQAARISKSRLTYRINVSVSRSLGNPSPLGHAPDWSDGKQITGWKCEYNHQRPDDHVSKTLGRVCCTFSHSLIVPRDPRNKPSTIGNRDHLGLGHRCQREPVSLGNEKECHPAITHCSKRRGQPLQAVSNSSGRISEQFEQAWSNRLTRLCNKLLCPKKVIGSGSERRQLRLV